MQTTKRHFASVLAGGVLVLLAAGSLQAAEPFSSPDEQIRGIGAPVAENGFDPAASPSAGQEEPNASGEQGGNETDHWFRWRYRWHYHYYYRPVRYHYHYCYYYYPRVVWYPWVATFDGANGQDGTSQDTGADKLVADGHTAGADSQ